MTKIKFIFSLAVLSVLLHVLSLRDILVAGWLGALAFQLPQISGCGFGPQFNLTPILNILYACKTKNPFVSCQNHSLPQKK